MIFQQEPRRPSGARRPSHAAATSPRRLRRTVSNPCRPAAQPAAAEQAAAAAAAKTVPPLPAGAAEGDGGRSLREQQKRCDEQCRRLNEAKDRAAWARTEVVRELEGAADEFDLLNARNKISAGKKYALGILGTTRHYYRGRHFSIPKWGLRTFGWEPKTLMLCIFLEYYVDIPRE